MCLRKKIPKSVAKVGGIFVITSYVGTKDRKEIVLMKKILAVLLLLGMIFSCNIGYASTKGQIFTQVDNCMEHFVRSNKAKYLGHEYFDDFMGDPIDIYSLAYKDNKTSVIVDYYDSSLKQGGAWPYFSTTNPVYVVAGLKVGNSIKALTKSQNFYKNKGNKYSSDYEGGVLHFHYNKKGIITRIEYIYDDEPVASSAMDFIRGKRKANLK